jgi:hypothetical protein
MGAYRWVHYINDRLSHVINFDQENDRLYFDWFVKIKGNVFHAERNLDTMGEDYETSSSR